MNNVGKKIAELRLSYKLTQQKLSEMSGVNANLIAKIERGENCPSVVTLDRILKPLNHCVSISKIIKN